MNRRSLLIGTGLLIAAPAIVKASSLMPVRSIDFWDRLAARRMMKRYELLQLKGIIGNYSLEEHFTLIWGGKEFGDKPSGEVSLPFIYFDNFDGPYGKEIPLSPKTVKLYNKWANSLEEKYC